MKNLQTILLLLFAFVSCMPNKSEISINVAKKKQSTLKASVSSVQIINNQLVIDGNGFTDVTEIRVNGNSLNENFTIDSKTATKIIANSIRAFSFDVSKVFSLILSDANASATFAIDFSLCNATLNGKGFNCAAPVADKDVLAYDAVSGTWKPRPASGLNYLGTFDASSNPGAGPAIRPAGAYYVISDDGMIATVSFAVGDWLVSNGSAWQKIDNSTAVHSVHGRHGTITGQHGDYTLALLGDISFPTAPVTGNVLKFDGTHWVAADDLTGGGAGSVTTATIVNGAVTDAKIDTVSASKITGTITNAQIADGTIVNADINAAAAIDYSKLNIPNTTIPYAKLNIADGAIPAAKISGLPSGTAVLASSIVDGDTTHAPDGNSVFDALATKLDKTGGTITATLNVPPPVFDTEATTKLYVDTANNLRLNKSGGTVTGILNLDSDLKIKGGSNYVTLRGHAASGNYNFVFPASAGSVGYILSTDGSGNTSWVASPSGGAAPTGAAGGDLSGTYPNPAIGNNKITDTHIANAAISQSKINGLISALAGKISTETDPSVSAFAKAALPTCTAGQVLKADGTTLTCVIDNTGAGSYAGSANLVVVTDGAGALSDSTITTTKLGYLSGVSSDIQTQLNAKQATINKTTTAEVSKIRIYGANATNYVELSSATLSGNRSLVFPDSDGANGQILSTNGSGVLSWIAAGGTGDALVANPLSQFAATTSAQLAGVINNETGTGVLVFSNSPAFTGTPIAPTAAADTNTTQLATTAFVAGQASSTAPVMNGTQTVGTSLKYARADHVHASDTSRSPAAGSSSITTVGTVTAGVWDATTIALSRGGTGATTAAAARTNLGLGTAAVGTTGSLSGQIPILGANSTVGSMCTYDLTLGFTCNTPIPSGGTTWGSSMNGNNGTGLSLVMDNSYGASGVGQSIVMANTQTNAMTGLDINLGTSGAASTGLNMSGGNTSSAKLINLVGGQAKPLTIVNNSHQFPRFIDMTSTHSSVAVGNSYSSINATISRTNASANTYTDNNDFVYFGRTSISNNASAIFNTTGSVMKLVNNPTQTLGTLTDTVTVLKVHQSVASTGPAAVFTGGKVGIGTTTPMATLDVNGQILSREIIVPTGATANLALGNSHIMQSIGGSSITLQNMQDGGQYDLVIEDTTARTYTFSGCTTSLFSPANGVTQNKTIFTIRKFSTACYITWVTGFN